MIGAGARKGETERDIHAFMEGVQLERDQSLIVIHAEHGVEFALDRAMENRVGREGAGEEVMSDECGVTSFSSAMAGAMISISSRPSAPDSPAWGFRPATAMRGASASRDEKIGEQAARRARSRIV